MLELFKSKKFWTAVLGVAGTVAAQMFGLPEGAVMTIGGLVIALLFGQGLTDFGKEAAKIDSQK